MAKVKSEKAGRRTAKCKRYRDRMSREHNKAAKFVRHIRKFPQDVGTVKAFKAFVKKNPTIGRKAANKLDSLGVAT